MYIYAGLNSDLDTRNMHYSGMTQELAQMFSEFGPYRKGLANLFRLEKHNLGEPEERIMALSGTIGGAAGYIYTTFFNA